MVGVTSHSERQRWGGVFLYVPLASLAALSCVHLTFHVIYQVASKLGEIRTNFEVKLTKSVRKVEIDHPEPGETAPKADCVVPFL